MSKVITLNYPLNVNGVVNTNIESDVTLLEADIVIANPDNFYRGYSSSEGHDYLFFDDFASNTVTRGIKFRCDEIRVLLENGKVVIIFVSPFKRFDIKGLIYNQILF